MLSPFDREVSRTEGISTTDLVGRMLLLTKNHFRQGEKEYAIEKEGLLWFIHSISKNKSAHIWFHITFVRFSQHGSVVEPYRMPIDICHPYLRYYPFIDNTTCERTALWWKMEISSLFFWLVVCEIDVTVQ